MNNEDTKNIWDKKWTDYGVQPVNVFVETVYKKHISKLPTKISILDLGCGIGVDSEYLYHKGFHNILGVDFSPKAIEEVKKKINIPTILENIENLNFNSECFDVIYAHLSLHYFDDNKTKELFKKCSEWLKPNGFLFVKCKSTNDSIGKANKSKDNMFTPKGQYARHLFTKDYMEECLLSMNNGKIISIEDNSHEYHGKICHFVEGVFRKVSSKF